MGLFSRQWSERVSKLVRPDRGHLRSRTPRKTWLQHVSIPRVRGRIEDIFGLDHHATRVFGARAFASRAWASGLGLARLGGVERSQLRGRGWQRLCASSLCTRALEVQLDADGRSEDVRG